MKFAGSRDGEQFDNEYDSREEAVTEFPHDFDLEPGAKFSTGRVVVYKPKRLLADAVIDFLREEAWDRVGEVCEDWLYVVPKELAEALNDRLGAVVRGWLQDPRLTPTFFEVVEVEEHTVGPRGDE